MVTEMGPRKLAELELGQPLANLLQNPVSELRTGLPCYEMEFLHANLLEQSVKTPSFWGISLSW